MIYLAPSSIDEAVSALRSVSGTARVLAGGTDLLPRMGSGMPVPDLLVDLKKIPELMSIQHMEDGTFVIGAAVPGYQIFAHAALRSAWPGVTEAMDIIGSVQIQGRASLGGNLCNASPAADSVPALMAAGARCRIVGRDGERWVPVSDMITAPGRTCLRTDEFVVSITLPALPERSADAYLRMTPRTEMDIAIAGVGVCMQLDEAGQISGCTIALGAVSPVPVLAVNAARILLGQTPGEEVLARLRRNISAVCRPIDDKRSTAEYRSHVAGVLAARAVTLAWQRAVAKSGMIGGAE